MDTLTSAEFRKTYAKLRLPVIVTANGHPIGVWSPREVSPDGLNVWPDDKMMADSKPFLRSAVAEGERFNTQPFRGPIPKKVR